MQVAETLVSYGHVLHALIDNAPAVERQEAADTLLLHIKSLPVPARRLEGDALETFTSLLRDSDGTQQIDRLQTVTQLVRRFHVQIGELCDELAAEFDPNHIGSLGSHFIVTTERLLATADEALASARTAVTRKPVLDALELAHANRVRRSTVLPHLAGALAALRTTHNELVEKVDDEAVPLRSLFALRQAVVRLQTSLDMVN